MLKSCETRITTGFQPATPQTHAQTARVESDENFTRKNASLREERSALAERSEAFVRSAASGWTFVVDARGGQKRNRRRAAKRCVPSPANVHVRLRYCTTRSVF